MTPASYAPRAPPPDNTSARRGRSPRWMGRVGAFIRPPPTSTWCWSYVDRIEKVSVCRRSLFLNLEYPDGEHVERRDSRRNERNAVSRRRFPSGACRLGDGLD